MNLIFRRHIFGLSTREVSFSQRGFHVGDPSTRERLERIGEIFLKGYHAALEEDNLQKLTGRLNKVEPEFQGFAYEGAAMAAVLLDKLTPWRTDRFPTFLHGPGANHLYMLYVGAGWALARLRRPVDRFLSRLNPIFCWLVMDGYGFHEGYFYWQRYGVRKETPNGLHGYALRVFDQGLGRSLWFVDGADVSRLPQTIASFPLARQPDLWSGVGLACAYAGGVDCGGLEVLRSAASLYSLHLAQGAAFAAQARRRAGNPAEHTDLACQVLCGMSSEEAARATELALIDLSPNGQKTPYELWRARIRDFLLQEQPTNQTGEESSQISEGDQ